VELTLGMASSHYQKLAQAATSLVAVFIALRLTANYHYYFTINSRQ